MDGSSSDPTPCAAELDSALNWLSQGREPPLTGWASVRTWALTEGRQANCYGDLIARKKKFGKSMISTQHFHDTFHTAAWQQQQPCQSSWTR